MLRQRRVSELHCILIAPIQLNIKWTKQLYIANGKQAFSEAVRLRDYYGLAQLSIHEYPTLVFGVKILTGKQNIFRFIENEQVIEKQTCLSPKPTLTGGEARAGQDTLGFFIPSRHLLAWVKTRNTFLNGLDFPHVHPKGAYADILQGKSFKGS